MKSNKGSVIIASMIIAIVVAVLCGTFLSGVLGDYKMSLRSLKNNSALNLAEAGIDQAMYELKQKTITSATWTEVDKSGVKYYTKKVVLNRDMGSGDKGSISVVVDGLTDTANGPVITAQGRISQPGSPDIIKQVRVALKPGGSGSLPGPVSIETIDTNGGGGVLYDGYDSKFGEYGAQVPEGSVPARGAFRRKEGVLVNICDGITFTVKNPTARFNLNKSIMYGKIALGGPSTVGPGSGHFNDRITYQWDNDNGGSLFSSQTAGVAWNPTIPKGQKEGNPPVVYTPGYKKAAVFDDSLVITNVTYEIPNMPDKPTTGEIVYVPTSSDPLKLGTPGATTPKVYIMRLKNNPNEVNNVACRLSGQESIVIEGPTILVVDGDFSVTGTANLQIKTTGNASLRLYVKDNIKIEGNGLLNDNVDADKLLIIAASGGKEVKLDGNAKFIGSCYAKDSVVRIGGNGGWFGTVIAKQIEMKGNGGYHFDVSGGKWAGGEEGFTVKQWIELTTPTGTTYKRDSRLLAL